MTFDHAHDAPVVVLIHGLWVTPRSWEHWVAHYTAQGFQVLAPAWPGVEGEVEDLRLDPSSMAGIGLEEVVNHYEAIVRNLGQPAILIGHSFGGTVVQLLLDRGVGAAGVVVDSAAVKGVLPLPVSTLRSTWPVLRSPSNRRKALGLSPRQFHYAFANTLSEAESLAAYDRYHVPGSARVLFQGAFANFNPRAVTQVDFRNDARAPLLFIAGGADHIVPAKVNCANARLYGKSAALTDYHEFAGRSHLTIGQDGWQEVADYAMGWALNRALLRETPLA
ncbi:alpha/beta fold hydrolase [Streptomyces sp. LRE541]|uniref:alpha/beta hydrolase n=1 Tax=Streptomyces sp. LRE541 TaxID=2931983 RepID=UPI0020106169|nr:alpha/beta fold hydrolase [Streptomyces sp. LRE541]UPZ26640.1 alpha/beta fold hydrolase [Streptomyces sp. LRE541]